MTEAERQAHRANQQKYRETHREQLRAAAKRYYETHKDKCSRDMAAWRERNPEYNREYYRMVKKRKGKK